MTVNHKAVHFFHGTGKIVEGMGPLAKTKNPFVAGLAGFFFGAFGVGLYLGSWRDFFVCLALLVGLTIVIPGIGVVPGWLFSAVYGYARASKSNEHLA
jgi:hypothetical protein